MSNIIFGVKYWFKNKYMKYKLYNGFKNNKIILTNDKNRGVGKSTLLFELSRKYDMPIFVNTKAQEEYFNRHFKCKKVFLKYHLNDLRGRRFPNGILIDEGFDTKQIEELNHLGVNVRTGFYYNDKLM